MFTFVNGCGPAEGTKIADVDSDHSVSSSLDPSGISGMDITSAPLVAVPIPVESRAVRIDSSCVILPGFYCGASRFSGVGIIHTGRTRPDSISESAPVTPTDEKCDQVRKAGAGRIFPLQRHFVCPSNGC